MSEEQNKVPSEGEARVLSDDELKGIVGGGKMGAEVALRSPSDRRAILTSEYAKADF